MENTRYYSPQRQTPTATAATATTRRRRSDQRPAKKGGSSLLVDYSKSRAKEPLPERLSTNVPLRTPSGRNLTCLVKAASTRSVVARTRSGNRRDDLRKTASVTLRKSLYEKNQQTRAATKYSQRKMLEDNSNASQDTLSSNSNSNNSGGMDGSMQVHEVFGTKPEIANHYYNGNNSSSSSNNSNNSSSTSSGSLNHQDNSTRSFLKRLNKETKQRPPAPLYGQLFHSLSTITHRTKPLYNDKNHDSDHHSDSDDESVASTFSYRPRPVPTTNRRHSNNNNSNNNNHHHHHHQRSSQRTPPPRRGTLNDIIQMPVWDGAFEQSLSSISSCVLDYTTSDYTEDDNHRHHHDDNNKKNKKSFLGTKNGNLGNANSEEEEEEEESEDLLFQPQT
jgi:hypothetical protein